MPQKPKVLLVVRPTEGGIGKHIVTLSTGISKYFAVAVACPQHSPLAEKLRSSCVKVLPLPLAGTIAPRQDFLALKMLVEYMRSLRISLVHSHGAKAALIARPASIFAGVPVSVYTVHNSVIHNNLPQWKNNLIILTEYLLSLVTDGIITVSEALRREITVMEKIPARKITVIRNGINYARLDFTAEREKFKRQWNIPANRTVLGTVARLAPQKGLSVLVQAAAMLVPRCNLHFLIVGDGPLKKSLQEQIRAANLENLFTFTGTIKNTAEAYAAMNMFVLPSLTEGLPLSLLEAMACALPVVASSAGGIPEVVTDGDCGILVTPGNPEQLASGIARLLDHPQWARQLGARARQKVLREFDAGKMVEQVVQLYHSLLQRKALWHKKGEYIINH